MLKCDRIPHIKRNKCVRGKPADFFIGRTFRATNFLFNKKYECMGGRMQIACIKNPDEKQRTIYQIARVVYAETHAVSLQAVEALTSMIKNISVTSGRNISDIISDKNLFESLNPDSLNHDLLSVVANDKSFQMCVRVARRMMNGGLADCCNGATKFHHDGYIPQWATSRGYIAEIDGLLFYL